MVTTAAIHVSSSAVNSVATITPPTNPWTARRIRSNRYPRKHVRSPPPSRMMAIRIWETTDTVAS